MSKWVEVVVEVEVEVEDEVDETSRTQFFQRPLELRVSRPPKVWHRWLPVFHRRPVQSWRCSHCATQSVKPRAPLKRLGQVGRDTDSVNPVGHSLPFSIVGAWVDGGLVGRRMVGAPVDGGLVGRRVVVGAPVEGGLVGASLPAVHVLLS